MSPHDLTDTAKQEAIRQWTADPCGPGVSAAPGTADHIEQLIAERHAYAPWFDEALDYDSAAGLKVLDVGCGQGIDVARYARAGASITGIDLTPRHVELAHQHVDALGLTATIVSGDAERLPFGDGEFDRVSSNGVLHHAPNIDAALREIHRVLKLGGEARVLVYNRRSFHYWLYQVWQNGIRQRQLFKERSMAGVLSRGVERSSIGARPLVRVYGPGQLRKVLRTAGFKEVHTRVGVFSASDTPISAVLARRTHWLDDQRTLELIGRVGGWYVLGTGLR